MILGLLDDLLVYLNGEIVVFNLIDGNRVDRFDDRFHRAQAHVITFDVFDHDLAQCLGGVAGTMLAHLMFDLAPLAIGDHARSGPSQWLSEVVATFALVLTILGGIRHAPAAVPWLVGLVIVAAYWFTASTSFANPAVTLARGFTASFSGIALADVPGFVLAELAGALLAGAVGSALFGRRG